jgi:large repetitive protein
MKKYRLLAVIIILTISFLFLSVQPASAVPPLPSSFYGKVKLDGVNVPDGTVIHALINGSEYAHTTVLIYKGDTVYSLDVPGEDPDTAGTQGGVDGNTVTFLIGLNPADQTGTWHSGVNANLDLSGTAAPVDTPTPTLTPTVTQTPTNTPTFTPTPGMPGVPVLVSPVNNALSTDLRPKFDWNNAIRAQYYQFQLSNVNDFFSTIIDQTNILTSEFIPAADLTPNSTYYWRVLSCNSVDVCSGWSTVRYFRTALPAPVNLNVDSSIQNLRPVFTWELPASPAPAPTGYTLQVSKNTLFSQIIHTGTVKGMSYIPLASLPARSTLYWRVRANGSNGPSLWSEMKTVITGNPPTVPALTSPANNLLVSSFTPTLAWKKPTFPLGTAFKSYRLEVASDAAFAGVIRNAPITTPGVNFWVVDPALTPNTKYYWHVQACNDKDECSVWSTARNFRTPLPAPVSLIADGSIQNLRPAFTWDLPISPLPAPTGYTVQVSRDATFTKLVNTGTVSGMKYVPAANLPPSLGLYWRVRAKGANGPSAWSATATYATGNPPAIPSLTAPANNALVNSYTPNLFWSQPAMPGGTTFKSYHVEVATDAVFTSVIRNATIVDLASHSWLVDPALDPNKKYYWHVQACNSSDECSAWAKVRFFRTLILPPALSLPVDGNSTNNRKPVFDWSDVDGATGYAVQISKDAGFTKLVGTYNVVASTYKPSANLPLNTIATPNYWWRVRAKGSNGPSLWSDPWTITITP